MGGQERQGRMKGERKYLHLDRGDRGKLADGPETEQRDVRN